MLLIKNSKETSEVLLTIDFCPI